MKKLIPYLLSIALFASCASPKPVVRLTPKETKTTWEHGKQFVSYFKDAFVVHCAHHSTDENYIIFDVEVVNLSDKEVLVCPEKMVMYTDSGKWDPVINQIVYSTFPIYAEDPEMRILMNDLAQSQIEANQKNLTTASAVTAALSIPVLIAAASADAKDDSQRTITRTEVASIATETTLDALDMSKGVNAIGSELIYSSTDAWINYSLRKTTLSKNESVRGLVYFKKPDLTKYKDLRIDVPIGEDNYITFKYQAKLYYPGNYNTTQLAN
ncbi:hypothetical protein [Tenuifilum thalassicum]|uniref:Lipoprotein n=1 Tax=Tenuifilum thalassicum TaxID=2590900 RepID=A0A7D4BSF3_9BACT|nr:hypothetical protein [Tenuifilum thalassicum]QKG80361.1 hypothetical protein FHG85_08830 [Tenuifilum thalassicum]